MDGLIAIIIFLLLIFIFIKLIYFLINKFFGKQFIEEDETNIQNMKKFNNEKFNNEKENYLNDYNLRKLEQETKKEQERIKKNINSNSEDKSEKKIDLVYKDCSTKEDFKKMQNNEKSLNVEIETGFTWWKIWGWLSLTLGNLILINSVAEELVLILFVANTFLIILVLRLNKYAFLIATVLSINPLLWIINGIYLKNRWNHPKVNKEKEKKDIYNKKNIYYEEDKKDLEKDINLNFEDELLKKVDLVFSFNALDSLDKKQRISNLIDRYTDKIKESKLNELRVKYRIEIKTDEIDENQIVENQIVENQIVEKPKLSTIANPINWYKYSKIIVNAEKKFQDIYNFNVPNEHKNYERILSLAFCLLFEEMRLNKVLPDDAINIMQNIREKSNLYNYITPIGKDYVNWVIYKVIYEEYIDQRAYRERPIISTIIAMNSIKNPISEDDKKILREEFNKNPIFGTSV